MPALDPVAKLEEVLVARGMLRKDIPGFIERYAKRPVLSAAQELQQRGIRDQIAYDALAKLQEPEITRESTLEEPFNSSAAIWTLLGLVSFGAGLWTLKQGTLAPTLGPWLYVGLFALGLLFFIWAFSKWIG